MQIIGFNLEKIHAERKSVPKGKVEVSSNIDVKSISEEKISIAKDQASLKLDFSFMVKYNPDVAEISFQGFIVALSNKDEIKEVLKKWKAKKIDDDVRIPLFNFILNKCNIRALQLEEEFALPSHIPLPRLSLPQEQDKSRNYAG